MSTQMIIIKKTRIQRNWKLHMGLMGMQTGTATVERSLAVARQITCRTTISPSNYTKDLSKRIDNIFKQKLVLVRVLEYVHSSTIHNS